MDALHHHLAQERARASAAEGEAEQAAAVVEALDSDLARTRGLIRSLSRDAGHSAPSPRSEAASAELQPPPGLKLLEQLAWKKRQQQRLQQQNSLPRAPPWPEQDVPEPQRARVISVAPAAPPARRAVDEASALAEHLISADWAEEHPLDGTDIVHALFDGLLGVDDDAAHPQAAACPGKVAYLALISNCGGFSSARQWAQLCDYAGVASRVAALARREAECPEDLETLVAWRGPPLDLWAVLAARNDAAEDEAEALRRMETQSRSRNPYSGSTGNLFSSRYTIHKGGSAAGGSNRSLGGAGSSRSLGSAGGSGSGSSLGGGSSGSGPCPPFKIGWLKKKGGGTSRNWSKGGRRTWKTRRFELDNPLLAPGGPSQSQLKVYSWTEGTSDKELKVAILLRGAYALEVESDSSKRHLHRFKLVGHSVEGKTGDDIRELLMNAESVEERRKWVTALRAAITAANGGGSSGKTGSGISPGKKKQFEWHQRRQRVMSLVDEITSACFDGPSFTVHVYVELSEAEAAAIPPESLSEAERESLRVVTEVICGDSTTVRNVLEALLLPQSNAGTAYHLKRRGAAEMLCDDDTVLCYEFVQQRLKEGGAVEVSVTKATVAAEVLEPEPEPELMAGDVGISWLAAGGGAAGRGSRSRRPGSVGAIAVDDGEEEDDFDAAITQDEGLLFADDPDAAFWTAAEQMDSDGVDPLKVLNRHQRAACWHDRERYARNSRTLTWLLQSVPDWGEVEHVAEAMRLLRMRPTKPKPEVAMQLLDRRFWCVVSDSETEEGQPPRELWAASAPFRRYATECLSQLDDQMLHLYLLEVCQLLKHEPVGDAGSGLGVFLLYRALRSPYRIGLALYWHLRSEMHAMDLFPRYGLLLRRFLVHAGSAVCAELRDQETLVLILRGAVGRAKQRGREHMPKPQQLQELRVDLADLAPQIPKGLRLPVDPSMRVGELSVEKCVVFGSAQKPLLLQFTNSDPTADAPVAIIFKDGDDVRQDALCLQGFNLMRQLWMNGGALAAPSPDYEGHAVGVDIPMSPWGNAYGCVSLGHEVGMLECVTNSETLAAITVWGESTMARGVSKLTGGGGGAWNHTHLMNWLQSQHDTEDASGIPPAYTGAVDNFIRSCAGYSVATYLLGIKDRHNDNVMLAKSGHFVHIDFGHILGHAKYFMGLNRDASPFVFPPSFAVLMGGADKVKSPNFKRFEDLCCELFLQLRDNAPLFLTLISLMFEAGLPELSTADDLNYMKDKFHLSLSDDEAANAFRRLIHQSLHTKMTSLNWFVHIAVHNGKMPGSLMLWY